MWHSFLLLLGGMPMPLVKISEVARPRVDVVSFFLLGLFLSAAVVMVVWNSLRKDFPRLPHLTYVRSCGLVVLWGLLFVIVLTMISGARELMTPGAWEKQGLTYKLRDEEAAQKELDQWVARRTKIKQLEVQLVEYAADHEGSYPAALRDLNADPEQFELPDLPGTQYILIGGRTSTGPSLPLAYEPEVYDGKRFVIFTKGPIEELSQEEIRRLVERAK